MPKEKNYDLPFLLELTYFHSLNAISQRPVNILCCVEAHISAVDLTVLLVN